MSDMVANWWEAVIGSTVVTGILAFFGMRTMRRIDRTEERVAVLDQVKADRSDVDKLIDELKADRKDASESRRRLHEKFDRALDTQNQINREVAQALGRLAGGTGS